MRGIYAISVALVTGLGAGSGGAEEAPAVRLALHQPHVPASPYRFLIDDAPARRRLPADQPPAAETALLLHWQLYETNGLEAGHALTPQDWLPEPTQTPVEYGLAIPAADFEQQLTTHLYEDPLVYARTPNVSHAPGEPLYETQLLSAGWEVMRTRSPLLRRADTAARTVQEATTLKYTSAAGRRYSARAAGSSEDIALRLRAESGNRATIVEAHLGITSANLRWAWNRTARELRLALEYDVDEGHRNHKVLFRIERGLW